MAEFNVKSVQGILTRKTGPLPNWVWIVVGVGAIYIYKRATAPKVPAEAVTTADSSYGDEGYPAYAGYGGTTPYDAGGASVSDSGIPESIPLTFEGEIPVNVSIDRGGRRHDRNPKVKKITTKIKALKGGGVTKAERPKIKRLRERRRSLR